MPGYSCPYGYTHKPDAPHYYNTTEAFVKALYLDWWTAGLAGLLARLIGKVWDVWEICSHPRPDVPDWDLLDLIDPDGAMRLSEEGVKARLWDLYVTCADSPGGCEGNYNPDLVDQLTLDSENAEVLEEPVEGGGGGGDVAAIGYYRVEQPVFGPILVPPLTETGDFLCCWLIYNDAVNATGPPGWTMQRRSSFNLTKLELWTKFRAEDDPAWYDWGNPALASGLMVSFRNCDPTTPIQLITANVEQVGSPIVLPGASVARDGSYVCPSVGGYCPSTSLAFSPEINGLNAGLAIQEAVRWVPADAGPTGDYTEIDADTEHARFGFITFLQPGVAEVGNYYRWKLDDALDRAFGIMSTMVAPWTLVETGAVYNGFWIEERWSVAFGGTITAGHRFDIYDYAQIEHQTWSTLSGGQPVAIRLHECNPTPPTESGPPPPADYVNPYPAPGEELHDLANAIQALERKLDLALDSIAWLMVRQSPVLQEYSLHLLPERTQYTGTFYDAVIAALDGAANIGSTGWAETVLASGVEGSWSTTSNYAAFRVDLTAIPTWAGRREGSPTNYEVNSRALQLGWVCWRTASSWSKPEIIQYAQSVFLSPVDTPDGFAVVLRPGVVATISGLAPVYPSS